MDLFACSSNGHHKNISVGWWVFHVLPFSGSFHHRDSAEFPLNEAATWMQTKRDAIARFIYVIKPLADIFRLSLSHIHVFCDREGGLIAMNRNGGIFLNLRYFEQWRTYFNCGHTRIVTWILLAFQMMPVSAEGNWRVPTSPGMVIKLKWKSSS